MIRNPYQQYRATKVETAGSVDLVVMLYQGAVKFVRLGIDGLDRNDSQAAHTSFLRAQDIVAELMSSLDREKGGAIASQLASVYDYCFRRLILANVKRDRDAAREVIGILRDLGTAWQQIAVQQRQAGAVVGPRTQMQAIAV